MYDIDNNSECKIHYCSMCLLDIFDTSEDETEDLITFKQWIQTYRITRVTIQLLLQQLIKKVHCTSEIYVTVNTVR